MKWSWKKAAVCLAAVVLVGCAGRVSVDYDKDVSFREYQSYGLVNKSDKSTDDARLDSPLIDRRIRRAVHENLQAKGFRQQFEPAATDFDISYQINLKQEIATDPSSVSMGFGTGFGRTGFGLGYRVPYGEVESSDMCMLTIDVIANPAKELVWRGTAIRSIESVDSPDELDRFFARLVAEILARFPPR